jgi:hypothetical protein
MLMEGFETVFSTEGIPFSDSVFASNAGTNINDFLGCENVEMADNFHRRSKKDNLSTT